MVNRQQNVVNMQQNVFYISVFCLRTQQLRVNYIEISFLYAELMDERGAYLYPCEGHLSNFPR